MVASRSEEKGVTAEMYSDFICSLQGLRNKNWEWFEREGINGQLDGIGYIFCGILSKLESKSKDDKVSVYDDEQMLLQKIFHLHFTLSVNGTKSGKEAQDLVSLFYDGQGQVIQRSILYMLYFRPSYHQSEIVTHSEDMQKTGNSSNQGTSFIKAVKDLESEDLPKTGYSSNQGTPFIKAVKDLESEDLQKTGNASTQGMPPSKAVKELESKDGQAICTFEGLFRQELRAESDRCLCDASKDTLYEEKSVINGCELKWKARKKEPGRVMLRFVTIPVQVLVDSHYTSRVSTLKSIASSSFILLPRGTDSVINHSGWSPTVSKGVCRIVHHRKVGRWKVLTNPAVHDSVGFGFSLACRIVHHRKVGRWKV
jgi:hypothetical protein